MNPSTTKKVVVSRFDREMLTGFVNPRTYLTPAGLELLSITGSVVVVPFAEVRAVYFVRDFQHGEPRTEKLFTSRPKLAGLWIRMRFKSGEVMDGVLANNLLQLEPFGFTVVPPNPGFQNQRVFVPKEALVETLVMGVVGRPVRTLRKAKPISKEQIEMFGQAPGQNETKVNRETKREQ